MTASRRMTAAVLHGRQDVRIESVAVGALSPGEVLLRTEVALTCGTDVKVFRRGYHARMIVPPALFGHELAGVVEEVGPGVAGLERGARVAVANSAPCGECVACRRGRQSLCSGLQFWNGAYAQYARIPARIASVNLVPLPPGLSLRHAALAEPLACVVRGLEACRIRAGDRVAVIGVGPIGMMFVTLARSRGADVVVAGRRPERLRRALAMGAQLAVAAGAKEELGHRLREASPAGEGFDVVVEAVGLAETCQAAVDAARSGGLVNLFAGCPAGARIEVDAGRLHYQELTVTSTFHHTPAAFREALRLLASGAIDADAFITAEAPLTELPELLGRLAHGSEGLKTAVLPWG